MTAQPTPTATRAAQLQSAKEQVTRLTDAYRKCGCGVCAMNLILAQRQYDRLTDKPLPPLDEAQLWGQEATS